MGALSIVILSGITWFILWLQQSPFALEARSIHKSLTILIEIYIYGHGGLGVIHFIIWKKIIKWVVSFAPMYLMIFYESLNTNKNKQFHFKWSWWGLFLFPMIFNKVK
nr:hypothetical protein [Providencia sp. G1(2023)]